MIIRKVMKVLLSARRPAFGLPAELLHRFSDLPPMLVLPVCVYPSIAVLAENCRPRPANFVRRSTVPSCPPSERARPIIIFSHFRASAEKCGRRRRRRRPSERGRSFPLFPSLLSRAVCTTTMRVPAQLRSRLGPLPPQCLRPPSLAKTDVAAADVGR